MDKCSNSSEPSETLGWQTIGASRAYPLIIAFLALALGAPAGSQEPPHPAESIVEAARNIREHKANSKNHPRVFTKDDLARQYPPEPSAPASPLESSSKNEPEVSKPEGGDCDNPDAERLKMELMAAQGEQDQIRRELSYHATVISGGNFDLKNFKPGTSGVDVGGPPLLESKPLVPARMTEVNLDEKIASLTRALRIACDSPKDAGIQTKLDQAEQEVDLLQREFVLDQNVYYSKTNYAQNTEGKAKLDAELQQIQYLQSEIESLKAELATSKANPSIK